MLEAGLTQKKCAKIIGVDTSTVRRWWCRYKKGESLQNKGGRGPKSSIPRVMKIILAKSINKRNQSTRKLAKRITARGFHITHATVHSYLRKNLHVKPYMRQRHPLLTEKQLEARLNFCEERKNWTIEDWKRVLFSDESPFEILYPPNRQNDRIWAKDSSQIIPVKRVKFSNKIHVWGMMSYRALSELHIVPKGQTITAEYYVTEILKNSLLSAIRRKRKTGNVLIKAMLPEMSKFIFQQDGAPSHHAKISQEW